MRSLRFFLTINGLYLLGLLITAPIPITCVVGYGRMNDLEPTPLVLGVKWTLVVVGVSGFVGLHWLTGNTATLMTFEGHSMGTALRRAWGDARLVLAFLPLVGQWFDSRPETDLEGPLD